MSDPRDRRLLACVRYPPEGNDQDGYRIYAQQWVGEGESLAWLSQGWVEWWPKISLVAHSFQEASRLQEAFLAELLNGIDEERFEKRLSPIAFVEAIEHPSGKWLARIYQHQDGRFEVKYLRWSVGRGGGLWANAAYHRDIVTHASDLASARQAAQSELDECATQAEEKNPQ